VNLHGIQHVAGVHGHSVGIVPTQSARAHEGKIRDPHITHSARHGPHVPSIPGTNKDDSQVVQTTHTNRTRAKDQLPFPGRRARNGLSVALPEPADNFFSLNERPSTATRVMALAIHDVGFEEFLQVAMQGIRSSPFRPHLLQELAETFQPFTIELKFDAKRSTDSKNFGPNVLFHEFLGLAGCRSISLFPSFCKARECGRDESPLTMAE
jgi:hypothetical protein